MRDRLREPTGSPVVEIALDDLPEDVAARGRSSAASELSSRGLATVIAASRSRGHPVVAIMSTAPASGDQAAAADACPRRLQRLKRPAFNSTRSERSPRCGPPKRAADEMRPVTLERARRRAMPRAPASSASATPRCSCTASLEERGAALAARPGKGWVTAEYAHAAARHARRAPAARRRRQAVRPDPGDPAPDRPLAARRGRHAGAGREPDHRRLRRAPGRWRHPHRRDHRRLGGAARLHRLDARPLDHLGEPLRDHVAAVSCGIYAARRCSTSTTLEDAEAHTDANFVHDRLGRHRRDPGHRRERAVLARPSSSS